MNSLDDGQNVREVAEAYWCPYSLYQQEKTFQVIKAIGGLLS